MACGARSGLKLLSSEPILRSEKWLNGLWSPFGFETDQYAWENKQEPWLNGLWSPFGFETWRITTVALVGTKAEASPPGSPNQANSYIR